MLKRCIVLGTLGLFFLGILGVAGCFGSKKDNDPDPLDVTGTWTIEMLAPYPTMIATLTYSNTTIGGTIADSDSYSVSISGVTTAPAGTKELRTLTLTITFNDTKVATLTGTVGDNNDRMSGTYTIDPGGSGDPAGSGDWTAQKQ